MKFKILIFLIISYTAFSQTPDRLTLDYCIKQALENNSDIISSQMDMHSAESKMSGAKTLFYPVIEFSGSYTRMSEIDPFSISLPTGQAFNIYPSIENNYGLTFTFKQPLFTGSRIKSGYEIAQNTFRSKENNLKEVKNSVKYAVQEYFWRLVQGIESEKVVDESLLLVKSHLRDVNNLKENGMASDNDVKKVEVQLSNLKLMKTTIEKNIDLSKSVLCRMMNIALDTEFDIDYFLERPNGGYKTDKLISTAIQNRPLIKSMQNMVSTAQAGKKMAKAEFLPSVYLIGNYNYAKPNRNIFPVEDKWKDTWNAGIMVQYTLWNWGRKKNDYESADFLYKKLETDLKNLISRVELDIKRVNLEIEESEKKYELSLKMVEQAEENYRISRDKYKNGILLNSELLDAEVDLLEAKLEVTKSIIDFNIKTAELKKTAGIDE